MEAVLLIADTRFGGERGHVWILLQRPNETYRSGSRAAVCGEWIMGEKLPQR